jgi:hypothetical protein
MSSTAWLRSTVIGQPQGPSQGLQAQLRAAGLDAGEHQHQQHQQQQLRCDQLVL